MRVPDEELQRQKKWFSRKRDLAIARLNRNIEKGDIESIEEAYTVFIRAHKQWLLVDDALIVYKLEHTRK